MISVIIPVYNHAHTLKKCLDSVLAQTYRPIEIIIVNDGSTDNFEEVVSVIASPDLVGAKQSLRIIFQPNQGASSARNTGFAESKGDYIIFWDADTVAKPDMLEKMYQTLQNNPEASYAYCKYKFGWKTMKSGSFEIEKLRKNNFIDTTSLIRRAALFFSAPVIPSVSEESLSHSFKKQVVPCPFDPSLKRFQDWDLWLTLLEQGKTGVFIPEILYKKITNARRGISAWLPSFMYRLSFLKKVKKYEAAKEVVLKKHNLD